MAELTPNRTVYVRSINERIKPNEVKRSLYELCSQFGKVVKVFTRRSLKMKGQAFVAFEDISSATQAVRDLQGFVFFGKPIQIQFARVESGVTAKATGTYEKRDTPMSESTAKAVKPVYEAPSVAAAVQLPNNILFIESLPVDATTEMLNELFGAQDGFKETRMMAGRPGLAFVEFQTDFHAGNAMNALQGFKFTPTNLLRISYAKK